MTMGRPIAIALAFGALAFAALAPLTVEHEVGAVPAPPNDDFADAVAISSLPFNDLDVDTSAATMETDEPSPSLGDCTGVSKTVWYTFTPATNLVLQGDTFGSSFDTVLAAYTEASLPTLTNVDCNDDDAGLESLQSQVIFSAMAGVTYRFQVGGFPGIDESGSLDFHLAVASAPNNDDFDDAEAIAAIPFEVGPYSTAAATTHADEPPSCVTIGKTVWYDFTPSVDTFLRADTFGSVYNTVLAVYAGASLPTLFSIACNDDASGFFQSQVEFSAMGGVTYHFQVGGFSGESGNLVFHLAQTPPDDDADGDGVQNAVESACGSNAANAASLPERIDGTFATVDDDADTLADEALPAGGNTYDCDRDGFVGTSESSIGTNDQDPCGNNGWPADLNPGSPDPTDNKLTIGDFNSFLFPLRSVNDGHGTFNKFGHPVPDSDPNIARWNLDPNSVIDIADWNALSPGVNSPTARPPMFGGQPAFFTNGGQCPWPP